MPIDTSGICRVRPSRRIILRKESSILNDLVPLVIHLLMDNPDEDWGDPCYPVVGQGEPYP